MRSGAASKVRISAGAVVERLESRALMAAGVDGVIDPTFGDAGGVAVYPGFWIEQSALLPDGRIAVTTGNRGMEVAVIGVDGRLDPAFGGGDGIAAGDVDTEGKAWRIAVQGDGKIVVSDFFGSTQQLARYNPDGTRDATFDGDGKLALRGLSPVYMIESDGGFDLQQPVFGSLAVRPDGRIFSAGVPFAEITPDGARLSAVDFDVQFLAGVSLAATAPDGTVVVGTVRGYGSSEVLKVESFGPAGERRQKEFLDLVRPRMRRVLINTGGPPRYRREMSTVWTTIETITVLPNGKVLIAAEVWSGAGQDSTHAVVLRLNPDLSPDETFGKGGVFKMPDKGVRSSVSDVVPLPDGKVLLPVHVFPDRGDSYDAVLRLTADGKRDRTFGRRGESRVLNEDIYVLEATVQSDGKYVVYGYTKDRTDGAAARYVLEEARRK